MANNLFALGTAFGLAISLVIAIVYAVRIQAVLRRIDGGSAEFKSYLQKVN